MAAESRVSIGRHAFANVATAVEAPATAKREMQLTHPAKVDLAKVLAAIRTIVILFLAVVSILGVVARREKSDGSRASSMSVRRTR
jgi:hypothetical protein